MKGLSTRDQNVLTPENYQSLTMHPDYLEIPIRSAIDKGYQQWWAQTHIMVKTAASMAIWEVCWALDYCYRQYEALPELQFDFHWRQKEDGLPQENSFRMSVNGRFFEPDYNEMTVDVQEAMEVADNLAAMYFLYKVCNTSMIANRKIIATHLQDAFVNGVHTRDQIQQILAEHAEGVSSRIAQIVLQETTPDGSFSPRQPGSRL